LRLGGRVLLLAGCLLTLPACYQQMATQPAYRPLQPSTFFRDERSARQPVAGTVARGQLRDDPLLYEGRNARGEVADEFPFEMTEAVLKRGQERYNIFCSVCHGLTGQGDGRIVQRGFTKPPVFSKDLSRAYLIRSQGKDRKPLIDVPVGHIYDVITHGFGAMPDYAEQVPVRDRWAIVGYVRALQYSQSPQLRERMKGPGGKGGKK
jgi:mono/diheme cytochrome c family protein